MFANMTGWHLLIVLAVILLLFGASRLPALAKSMGQSAKLFKREIRSDEDVVIVDSAAGDESATKRAAEPSVGESVIRPAGHLGD
ncbi:twin-arginine translocase TatA/TatE family subunit [Microbacterium aurantiacum]|uniref:Sec-independent protein translocase protein TatA n=1 Tax=Microbacterium aurantiacum TaxID=162393 RepID=A0AAJ2HK01_9MICO|nr:twin-arginine translocase TatA/TatE family subunit [Microbacterium aurantiacum]MDS0244268.1 twin-arginine translocase TatA/TatE family subunit [Microbacterium aurantiacum]